jgi:hypothetical protein
MCHSTGEYAEDHAAASIVASYPYDYSRTGHPVDAISIFFPGRLECRSAVPAQAVRVLPGTPNSTSQALTAAARFSLLLWSPFFNWREARMIVKPETLIGWHGEGFKLWWRWKSRLGRPRISHDLRRLMVRIARENPTWGEERVAGELSLKLGILVSPRTVRAYWPQDIDPSGCRRTPSQHWGTFVRNHAKAMVAADFLVPSRQASGCSMSWWSWKSAAAAFCTVTSRLIRLQPGLCSSFEKRFPAIIATAS